MVPRGSHDAIGWLTPKLRKRSDKIPSGNGAGERVGLDPIILAIRGPGKRDDREAHVTEPHSVDRRRIIETLAAALEAEPTVLAAWLGGSDATGRTDEFSDIDLQTVVEDDRVEETFALVEKTLSSLSPIALRHRIPEPTWHGHSQCFYRLRDADPHHFVDFVPVKRSAEDRFLEPERHGEPVVLFDREGLLAPTKLDRVALRDRMEKRLAALREMFLLFQPLAIRAVARGHDAEAAYWYHNLGLKPLVELLRIRHCPDRFDFGLRYLDRDLPGHLREEIERLAYPADPRELDGFRSRIEDLFVEEMAAFDRGDWGLASAD